MSDLQRIPDSSLLRYIQIYSFYFLSQHESNCKKWDMLTSAMKSKLGFCLLYFWWREVKSKQLLVTLVGEVSASESSPGQDKPSGPPSDDEENMESNNLTDNSVVGQLTFMFYIFVLHKVCVFCLCLKSFIQKIAFMLYIYRRYLYTSNFSSFITLLFLQMSMSTLQK